MGQFLYLIRKDLKLELRSKQALALIISLALLLSLITAVGINDAFLTSSAIAKIYLPLLWVISLFIATLSISRSFEFEIEQRAVDGVILTGVNLDAIFYSKTISNLLIMLVGHLVTIFTLAAFLNVPILNQLPNLLLVSFLTLLGYSALGTLLSAMTVTSKLRGMLLPMLLLPLSFPLFFAALEVGLTIFDTNQINLSSFWFEFLGFLDFLYIALGAYLFQFVIKD